MENSNKIELKKWLTGKVIFSYECENNTIKRTLKEAVNRNINLDYADLLNADLSHTNLSNALLMHANLIGANLEEANLINANLEWATINDANLQGCDLSNAILSNASIIDSNLQKAVMRNIIATNSKFNGSDLRNTELLSAILNYSSFEKANLSNAFLNNANMTCTNLEKADLRESDLTHANLNYAMLYEAKLENANLYDSFLYKASLGKDTYIFSDLKEAINIPNLPMSIPEGEFIAWKKITDENKRVIYIIKLKILNDSKRSKATTNKCRCDKALVLEFQDLEGNKLDITEFTSHNFAECTYKVGEIVYADSWDDNRWNECSHGIHFFLSRQEAVNFHMNVRITPLVKQ